MTVLVFSFPGPPTGLSPLHPPNLLSVPLSCLFHLALQGEIRFASESDVDWNNASLSPEILRFTPNFPQSSQRSAHRAKMYQHICHVFRYPNNQTLMQYLSLPNISEREISSTNYIFTLAVFCNSASFFSHSQSGCNFVDRRRFKDISIAYVGSKWSLYKVNRIVLEQNFILLMSAKWLFIVTQNNEFFLFYMLQSLWLYRSKSSFI